MRLYVRNLSKAQDKYCPFCNHNRKDFLEENGYNVPEMYFYEDNDFSISPDLSPLVTGHLLVIPTYHYASFGEIIDYGILHKIRSITEQLLDTADLLIFEHGAVIEGEGGASVDHAHMHVMPRPVNMTVDLIDRYISQSGCVTSSKVMAPQNVLHTYFRNKQPYIFYELQGQRFAYPVHTLPHQFLRMMLQPYCQLSYNWRITYSTDECRNNVQRTIEYIKQIKQR